MRLAKDRSLHIINPSDEKEKGGSKSPRKIRGIESQITSDSHEVIVSLCEKLGMVLSFLTKYGDGKDPEDLNEAFALCVNSLVDASFVKGMLHTLIKGKDE